MYVKITKPTARRLYNEGSKILLTPCHLRPIPCGVYVSNASGRDFDKLINEFEYYNCNNETGRYAAYYVWET